VDALGKFVEDFLGQPMAAMQVPSSSVRSFGNLVSVVIWRRAPFQVELVTVLPEFTGIAPHRHPTTESYEIAIAGRLMFIIGGDLATVTKRFETERPLRIPRGMAVRVKPGDWHAVLARRGGGMFFSCQHWLKSEPTSIGLDWEGPSFSSEHAQHRSEDESHQTRTELAPLQTKSGIVQQPHEIFSPRQVPQPT
jgi:hypothetical protein